MILHDSPKPVNKVLLEQIINAAVDPFRFEPNLPETRAEITRRVNTLLELHGLGLQVDLKFGPGASIQAAFSYLVSDPNAPSGGYVLQE